MNSAQRRKLRRKKEKAVKGNVKNTVPLTQTKARNNVEHEHIYFIEQQGILGAFFDLLMLPVMQYLMGSFEESAQRTHFWNNKKFHNHHLLKSGMMIHEKGIESAPDKGLFRFHCPRFGGWKNSIVLKPPVTVDGKLAAKWFIGWVTNGGVYAGYSMVPIFDMCKVLIGSGDVSFFALTEVDLEINKENVKMPHGMLAVRQVRLMKVGTHVIGQDEKYSHVPLL